MLLVPTAQIIKIFLREKTGLSAYHFHRIMRARLNESLATYITRQRMERAVMYMRTKKRSLQELSEMVGYKTPQSFSKAFKQHFGISPIAFRNVLNSKFTVTKNEDNCKKPELSPILSTEKEI